MSENNPQLELAGFVRHKSIEAVRLNCITCGKCALVNTIHIGTPLQDETLRERGGMCQEAIDKAAKHLTPVTL